MLEYFLRTIPGAQVNMLTDNDIEEATALASSKYSTWEWNFGHSPDYNFRKVVRTENSGTLEFCMDVHQGIIRQTRIYGDYFSHADPLEIESALAGIPHEEGAIRKAVAQFPIGDYYGKLTPDEFVKGLF